MRDETSETLSKVAGKHDDAINHAKLRTKEGLSVIHKQGVKYGQAELKEYVHEKTGNPNDTVKTAEDAVVDLVTDGLLKAVAP